MRERDAAVYLKNDYCGFPVKKHSPGGHEVLIHKSETFMISFENTGQRDFGHFKKSPLDCVIPAWSAGIQVDTDVSGSILANLDAGYPCRHDEVRIFHSLRASVRSWNTSW